MGSSKVQDTPLQSLVLGSGVKGDGKAKRNEEITLRRFAKSAGVPAKTVLAAFSQDAKSLASLDKNRDNKRVHTWGDLKSLQHALKTQINGKEPLKGITSVRLKAALTQVDGELGRRREAASSDNTKESKFEDSTSHRDRLGHLNVFNKSAHKLSSLAQPAKDSLSLGWLKFKKGTNKAAQEAGSAAAFGLQKTKSGGVAVAGAAKHVGTKVTKSVVSAGETISEGGKQVGEGLTTGGKIVGNAVSNAPKYAAASLAQTATLAARSIAKKADDLRSLSLVSTQKAARHAEQATLYQAFHGSSPNGPPDRKTVKAWVQDVLGSARLPKRLSQQSAWSELRPVLKARVTDQEIQRQQLWQQAHATQETPPQSEELQKWVESTLNRATAEERPDGITATSSWTGVQSVLRKVIERDKAEAAEVFYDAPEGPVR